VSAALLPRLRRQVEALSPGCFALVMGTGIVSIACHLLGAPLMARLLFWLNLGAFAILWLATAARALIFKAAFLADWTSHPRAPGFFTSVAATCVVGDQVVVIARAPAIGAYLWGLGLLLWAVCTYGILLALITAREQPSLAEGLNGSWLVAAVATQAICVLGCSVLPPRDDVLFLLTGFWLVGGMLYTWLIVLIFYRSLFFRIEPGELMPTYWINMGAMAISTLAGTGLIASAPGSALLASILPFLKGATLLSWATATWWIPLLLALGIWRHGIRRVAITYDPLYWGMVFPLGMYAVCTHAMWRVFGFEALRWIATGAGAVAVVAWATTSLGLLGRAVRG
jgi:tellurite resistance protein TehA-like permease